MARRPKSWTHLNVMFHDSSLRYGVLGDGPATDGTAVSERPERCPDHGAFSPHIGLPKAVKRQPFITTGGRVATSWENILICSPAFIRIT